jgi:hypothetical protein
MTSDGAVDWVPTSTNALDFRQQCRLSAMETVVRHAHCFEGSFVFGGYVRDLLINRMMPRDVDMCFKTVDDARALVRVLSNHFQVEDVQRKLGYSWGRAPFESLTARIHAYGGEGATVSFNVDLACGSRERVLGNDFTCNLLMLMRSALGLTSIPRSLEYHPSPLLAVMADVSQRSFAMVGGKVMLLQKEVGPYVAKLCNRSAKMVGRGWRLKMCESTFNTNRYSVVTTDYDIAPHGMECAICKSEFEPKDIVTRTLCNHLFHAHCITEWLVQGRSEVTCPVCREVHFMVRQEAIESPNIKHVAKDDHTTET